MKNALIAILRGVKPSEVISIAQVLMESGIYRIEVPLNSPDPFSSIEKLVTQFGNDAEIGAGTVLTVDAVQRLAAIGARMVVSPNCNPSVIRATKLAGMSSYPGVMTPTECFTALEAGADGLKFFPSNVLGPTGIAAIKSVLPQGTRLYAVGGVDAGNFSSWLNAGVSGFGIGSSLYKPGWSAEQVRVRSLEITSAYNACVE